MPQASGDGPDATQGGGGAHSGRRDPHGREALPGPGQVRAGEVLEGGEGRQAAHDLHDLWPGTEDVRGEQVRAAGGQGRAGDAAQGV